MTSKSYSADEFLKALASDALKTPIDLVGMTKPAVGDATAILFAPRGCGPHAWISLPLEVIDQVEHIATATCGDHEHPEPSDGGPA